MASKIFSNRHPVTAFKYFEEILRGLALTLGECSCNKYIYLKINVALSNSCILPKSLFIYILNLHSSAPPLVFVVSLLIFKNIIILLVYSCVSLI